MVRVKPKQLTSEEKELAAHAATLAPTVNPWGNTLHPDVIDGVVRCLCDPLFEDASWLEIAEACETTVGVVGVTLEHMRVREMMVHAGLVNDQLKLGMDTYPIGVITLALEELVKSRVEVEPEHDLPKGMRQLLKRLRRRIIE